MAFQITEELFQRIKAHLERETIRTGRKLTQREFVLGLIEEALDAAERREESDTACEAPSAPEEASAAEVEAQPQETVETSTEGGVTAV